MRIASPSSSAVGVNAKKEMFWGLEGGMNEPGGGGVGLQCFPPPVSRPLNVLIELDNLLGDGQDVLGPVVSVDLRSFRGGEVA